LNALLADLFLQMSKLRCGTPSAPLTARHVSTFFRIHIFRFFAFVAILQRQAAELSSLERDCYKFVMAYNFLDWFRAPPNGAPAEPRKQFAAGAVVWVLAWFVVWWSQDANSSSIISLGLNSIVSVMGILIGLGLFWGGGLLIFRSVTTWGYFLSWLRRWETVERLAMVAAGALTLSAILLHWIQSRNLHWLVAAVAALFVLHLAFGWKLPRKNNP